MKKLLMMCFAAGCLGADVTSAPAPSSEVGRTRSGKIFRAEPEHLRAVSGNEFGECPICLQVMKKRSSKNPVYAMTCHHGEKPDQHHTFHRSCLRAWFEQGKNSCPLCCGTIAEEERASFGNLPPVESTDEGREAFYAMLMDFWHIAQTTGLGEKLYAGQAVPVDVLNHPIFAQGNIVIPLPFQHADGSVEIIELNLQLVVNES